jgi:hypothetical protein
MTHPRYCSDCEQRYDICHCVPADGYPDEFEAMLDEPDEGTLERLRRPPLRSTMVARHVPRRLRTWRHCGGAW